MTSAKLAITINRGKIMSHHQTKGNCIALLLIVLMILWVTGFGSLFRIWS